MQKHLLWMIGISFILSFSYLPPANAQEKLFNIFGGSGKSEQTKTSKPIFLKKKTSSKNKSYNYNSKNSKLSTKHPQLSPSQTKGMSAEEINGANIALLAESIQNKTQALIEKRNQELAALDAKALEKQQSSLSDIENKISEDMSNLEKDPKNYVYEPPQSSGEKEPTRIWNKK